MEQCDKVILFGYLDGYTYELNGITNYVVVLETGERVEIPVGGVMSVDEFVEKDKIKLKDVIARIKKLDLGTQKVCLNEILNELGSDYGTLKYKAGYEQGKLEGEWVGQQLKDADKVRQELNKPVVKQFVADWYEEHKEELEFNIWGWIKYTQEEEKIKNSQFTKWLGDSDNNPVETLVKMKQFGYDVEEEKRYLVKMKGLREDTSYLNYDSIDAEWYFADAENGPAVGTHCTRKELESAGFGWVFDCPGIEIEKVE